MSDAGQPPGNRDPRPQDDSDRLEAGAQPDERRAASRLGDFELLRELGRGGMGVVYEARQVSLDRRVAVKLLTEESYGDERLRARFLREARTAAALNHPGICSIHEVGEVRPGEEPTLPDGARLEAGTPFISMELIEGRTLEDRLRQSGPLPLDELLEIALHVAEGLSEAHSRGIVHRDLKPGNVMLTPGGRAKILDFGLAKPLESAPEGDEVRTAAETVSAELTREGRVLGTVAYMSPEQAQGQSVDSRSDVFSFGIMLYEMATGRRPFQGETPTSTLAKILESEPEAANELRPDLPPELARIVQRCLRKRPEDRYHDTRDLVVALKDLRQETTSEKTGVIKAASRRSRVVLFGGLTALVVVVAAWVLFGGDLKRFLSPADEGGPVRSIAVLPFANVSGDPDTEYLSEGITESLINSLSPMADLKVMARSTVFRYKNSDRTPREVGQELQVGAVLAGRLDQRGERLIVGVELIDVDDGAQLWGERFDREMDDIFTIERAISRGIGEHLRLRLAGTGKGPPDRRLTENSEAYRLYLRGRYLWHKRTAEDVKKALEYFERSRELDPDFALAYTGIADAHVLAGGRVLGVPREEAIANATAAARRAIELDDTLAEAHNSLASVKYLQHDWEGSMRERLRALELNPGYAQARIWYSEHLSFMGRHDEAIAEARRALDQDPMSVYMNATLGKRYLNARRYEEAERQCLETLELKSDDGDAVYCIASSKLHGGSLDGLLPWLERMEADDSTEEELAALRTLYEAEGVQGYWRWRLARLEGDSPKDSYSRPWHTSVATCLAQLGRKEEALEILEQVHREGGYLHHIKTHPALDPLRDEPRFQSLIRQVFPDS